jgi:hypothetical protein
VLLWTIVAAREREDQRVVAPEAAELAHFAHVIGQLVVVRLAQVNGHPGFAALFQICSHHINQFFGGFHLGGVLAVVAGQNVGSNMAFHEFGH